MSRTSASRLRRLRSRTLPEIEIAADRPAPHSTRSNLPPTTAPPQHTRTTTQSLNLTAPRKRPQLLAMWSIQCPPLRPHQRKSCNELASSYVELAGRRNHQTPLAIAPLPSRCSRHRPRGCRVSKREIYDPASCRPSAVTAAARPCQRTRTSDSRSGAEHRSSGAPCTGHNRDSQENQRRLRDHAHAIVSSVVHALNRSTAPRLPVPPAC
mmetsp:Transcript_15761/g.42979  ORF Transcript_15761/g.42979 Transcript_15761/m.42979 type:complete len:210 (+) Transcript_15761:1057-1686(+)